MRSFSPGTSLLTVTRRVGTLLLLAPVLLALSAGTAWAQAETEGPDIPLPPAPQADPTDSKYPDVQEALRKFQRQDFDGALESLTAAAEKHPELSPPRLILAQMFFGTRQNALVGLARGLVEQVARELPDDPEAYITIGELARRENRFVESRLAFREARQKLDSFDGHPDRIKNLRIRLHADASVLAQGLGDWEEARTELQGWLALAPDSPQAHFRMGVVQFHLEQYDEAYESFKVAHQDMDQLPPPPVMMGLLYQRNGDHEKATEWMNRALEEAPEDPATLLGAAQWMLQTKQIDEAKPHAEKAAQLAPDSIDAKLLCGVIARHLGDTDAAERYFEAAHLQSPGNFAASNNLALTLVDQGGAAKLRRALELAEVNARQFSNNPMTATTLAWVYYHLKRNMEAGSLLQAVANTGQLGPDGQYYMARVLERRGDMDGARRYLRAAVNSPIVFVNRAEAEAWYDEIATPEEKEADRERQQNNPAAGSDSP